MVGSAESPGDTSRDAGALDDPKLGQLVQFQMAESFPWANHCDICAQPLHAWDVISKPFYSFFRRLALELPCLSLLELGRPLAWCGGTSRSISSVEQISDVVPQRDVGCANLKDDAWFLSSHLLSMTK